MSATVEFAGASLAFPIDPACMIGEWHGPKGRATAEIAAEVRSRLDSPLGFPALSTAVVPGDRVVIAIEPTLPEIRPILEVVCEILEQAGVNREEITVLATTKPVLAWDDLLPTGITGIVHDPDDRTQLAYLAATEAGRRVYLNRKAVDADFLLAIGPLGHDRMLGPQGPWTTLFPGLSDAETLQAFRSVSTEGQSSTLAMRESAEVSWLVGNQFQIGVVPGSEGIVSIVAGIADAVRDEGMKQYAEAWSFRVPERADLVIAGVGQAGEPSSLQDLAAAFGAATGLVRRGGKIAVLSRAEGEIGPALQHLIGTDEPRSAVASLKGAETEADFPVAMAIAKALAWADLYLLSNLGEDAMEDLGFIPLNRPEEALKLAAIQPVRHAREPRRAHPNFDRRGRRMTFDPDRPFLVDRSASIRLAVLGPDRAKFLHNLTTNEIKRKPVGSGCETFVTSPQGKTIGYFTALIGESELLLRTNAGGLALALPHFEKYGLFDDVRWEDRTATTFEYHVVGSNIERRMAAQGISLPGPENLQHTDAILGGRPVQIIRESPFGFAGLTIVGKQAESGSALDDFREMDAALQAPSPQEVEGLRIEAGMPEFGRDITPENLPQEIGRDECAISFVKGCYLGQETVARLDALGHVNKILKGLKIEGEDLPEPGTALLSADGKPAGVITSVGLSPRTARPIAMGIIRVAFPAGTCLTYTDSTRSGIATVSDLPLIPLASRTPVG